VLKTVEGFAAVRPVLLAVGQSFGLRSWAEFRMILFPAALPHIFTGLRLALVFALINVVGVEFLINLGGLGALINDLAERYDLAGTWAAIALVVLVSVCFFALLDGGERWLQRRS
jgi:NitT/TauT family transport system permease protein